MRKFLMVSTGLLAALAAPAAFAHSIIPTFVSASAAAGGSDFFYSVNLDSIQQIYNANFANFLTIAGGGLGSGTSLAAPLTGFLAGWTFSTGAHSITITCAQGATTCTTPAGSSLTLDAQHGSQTVSLEIFQAGVAPLTTTGTYNAQGAKYTPLVPTTDGTLTTNGGFEDVPIARVPEPISLALLGTGLLGLGLARRRNRHN